MKPFFKQKRALACQKSLSGIFLKILSTFFIQILILYGSQTGTGEELAGRLAKDFGRFGKKPLLIDPEEIEAEDLPKITEEFEDPILLLFVATYGEGDPTDKFVFLIGRGGSVKSSLRNFRVLGCRSACLFKDLIFRDKIFVKIL